MADEDGLNKYLVTLSTNPSHPETVYAVKYHQSDGWITFWDENTQVADYREDCVESVRLCAEKYKTMMGGIS
jgi:hypothetical protein